MRDSEDLSKEQRRELVFREEAEALREDLLAYLEADLADARLRDKLLEVVRDGFRGVVKQTLDQQDLRKRLAGDLAQSMLKGLQEALPQLQKDTLESIGSELEHRWAEALRNATRQTFEKVVEQQLVPQDLPGTLRSVLENVFSQRMPDLRQQAASVQQEQLQGLRRELDERWEAKVPGVLKQSLEQSIGTHLKEEALTSQVNLMVKERLDQIQVTASNRVDLGKAISEGQSRQLDAVRKEIEDDWNRILPVLVQQGLSKALPQHLNEKTLAREVDAAVSQRLDSLGTFVQDSLKAIEKLQQEQIKERENQIKNQLERTVPGLVQAALEKSLSQHLTEELILSRVESLITPRFKQIDDLILSRWHKGAEEEQSQIDAVRKEIAEHWTKLIPVLVEASLRDALGKTRSQIEESPVPPVEPSTNPPLEDTVAKIPIPVVGVQAPKDVPAANTDGEQQSGFWNGLRKRAAEIMQASKKNPRLGLGIAILAVILVSIALWYVSTKREPEKPVQPITPQNTPAASNVPANPVAPAPVVFSLPNAWTTVMSPQAEKLKSYQSVPRGNDLNGTYQCWFGGETPTVLEALFTQAKATRKKVEPSALVDAFPSCATNEVGRKKAAVAALQMAVHRALTQEPVLSLCQPADRQIVQSKIPSLDPANGIAGPATLATVGAFLRCSGLSAALEISESSAEPDLLFVVYAALREAASANAQVTSVP